MAARRKADDLIAAGHVAVNGVAAFPGQQVDPAADTISVDGRVVRLPLERTYVMMNKPAGVLTSVGDPRGRATVTDQLGNERRLFPVGRLDLQSRGLLLLTDDGQLAMRLMHPRFGVDKEYRVTIVGRPADSALKRLSEGLLLDGERLQPARVTVIEPSAEGTRLAMILREGRKREIRRAWQALGHRVLDLQRVRIDGIELGSLEEGKTRPLSSDEITSLKAAVS